jgi:hypothetical protein
MLMAVPVLTPIHILIPTHILIHLIMAMKITNIMAMKITNIMIMIITLLIMRRHVLVTMEVRGITMITAVIVIVRAFVTISWITPARINIAIAMAMSIITMTIQHIAITVEIMLIKVAAALVLGNSFLRFLLAICILTAQKITLQKNY